MKRNRVVMMEDLCDDLLFEIVLHLPLKLAVQFKCMNKRFNNLISNPQFAVKHALRSSRDVSSLIHCSCEHPKIFYNLPLRPPHTDLKSPPNSVTLPILVPIVASCSGLLLLHPLRKDFYCVSNPITRIHQLIPLPKIDAQSFMGPAGLVVDLPRALSSPHYKLVGIVHKMHASMARKKVYGFKIFASDANSWRESKATLTCTSSLFLTYGQTISLNGCLHWVRKCGNIIAFDTNKEQARIIKTPQGFELGYRTRFEAAEGFINLISTSEEEIVIWILHDYENGEWRVRTRIANITTIGNDYINYGIPVFFDGRQLFLQRWTTERDREVYMCDVMMNAWKKIGTMLCTIDALQTFIPFFPTLAKVSTINHVHHKTAEYNLLENINESVQGLTLLLTSSP